MLKDFKYEKIRKEILSISEWDLVFFEECKYTLLKNNLTIAIELINKKVNFLNADIIKCGEWYDLEIDDIEIIKGLEEIQNIFNIICNS